MFNWFKQSDRWYILIFVVIGIIGYLSAVVNGTASWFW